MAPPKINQPAKVTSSVNQPNVENTQEKPNEAPQVSGQDEFVEKGNHSKLLAKLQPKPSRTAIAGQKKHPENTTAEALETPRNLSVSPGSQTAEALGQAIKKILEDPDNDIANTQGISDAEFAKYVAISEKYKHQVKEGDRPALKASLKELRSMFIRTDKPSTSAEVPPITDEMVDTRYQETLYFYRMGLDTPIDPDEFRILKNNLDSMRKAAKDSSKPSEKKRAYGLMDINALGETFPELYARALCVKVIEEILTIFTTSKTLSIKKLRVSSHWKKLDVLSTKAYDEKTKRGELEQTHTELKKLAKELTETVQKELYRQIQKEEEQRHARTEAKEPGKAN